MGYGLSSIHWQVGSSILGSTDEAEPADLEQTWLKLVPEVVKARLHQSWASFAQIGPWVHHAFTRKLNDQPKAGAGYIHPGCTMPSLGS